MDTIYLAGVWSRAARRLVRYGGVLSLVPDGSQGIARRGRGRVTADSLGLESLRSALGMRPSQCIDVYVDAPSARIRARGIRSHVCSRALPPGSFECLELTDGSSGIVLPEGKEILVESACLSFVMAAERLTKAVRRGAMSAQEADLRLFKLGMEDCSSYALNPWTPQGGDCRYDVRPALSRDELARYLSQLHGFAGLERARRIGSLVFDAAASPMETFVCASLALPARLGGLGIERPAVNETIPLSDVQKLMLNHVDRITPDFLWKAFKVILEYLGGEPHEGRAAQDEDTGRIQDYQVLGYAVLPTTFKHVRTQAAFNRLAVRLAQVLDKQGAADVVAWVSELLEDEEFLARQRVLFAVMLPPVARD